MNVRTLNFAAGASLIALIFLCLAWELWLAPLRPGGSWLVLKVAPLLAPLFGTLRARRYTHQWSSLLALAYVAEGLVRATSDTGFSVQLATAEIVIATIWFLSCMFYARATAGSSG